MRITERDRELLAFAADHKLVLPGHISALLGVAESTASSRLRRLARGGYLRPDDELHGQPTCYLIRQRGLDVIGSDLPPPRPDPRSYRHDVGLAWLWLTARSGRLGPMREILSERQLRSHDGVTGRSGSPLGVRLGGTGPGGHERLHYPDLLLVSSDGKRIAVELELSSKWRPRLESILGGYGADARIDAVLYLVPNRTVGNPIVAAAKRFGLLPRVQVQLVRHGDAEPGSEAGRSVQRVHSSERQRSAGSGARTPAASHRRESGR
jgi:hypothetical protein